MMLAQVLSGSSLVGRGNICYSSLTHCSIIITLMIDYHQCVGEEHLWAGSASGFLFDLFESPERPCYMRFGDDFESSLVPSECGRATMLIQEGPMRSQLGIQSYTNEPDKITRGWWLGVGGQLSLRACHKSGRRKKFYVSSANWSTSPYYGSLWVIIHSSFDTYQTEECRHPGSYPVELVGVWPTPDIYVGHVCLTSTDLTLLGNVWVAYMHLVLTLNAHWIERHWNIIVLEDEDGSSRTVHYPDVDHRLDLWQIRSGIVKSASNDRDSKY